MARARSRAEQEQIVSAWRRSGQSARVHAARIGVSPASLHRWASQARTREAVDAPMFVEAVPSDAAGSGWAWELEVAGATLRVRDALEATTAKTLVEALRRAGRR